MNAQRLGIYIAQAALGANLLRFILVFLEADNIQLPTSFRLVALTITGVATGIVLTGGGIFTVHVLTMPISHAGTTRLFLVACWCLLLIFMVILLTPMMVLAIQHSPLQETLSTTTARYIWSIAAVVSVELLAAAGVASSVLLSTTPVTEGDQSEPTLFNRITHALGTRVERTLLGEHDVLVEQPVNQTPVKIPEQPVQKPTSPQPTGDGTKKQQTLEAMLALFHKDPKITQKALAEKFDHTPKTIRAYIRDLIAQEKLVQSEQGYVPIGASATAQVTPGD